MSNISRIFTLTAILMTLSTVNVVTAQDASTQSPATDVYSVGIKGLTCEMCSASAQRALAEVPGVLKSSIDYKTGHAWVFIEKPYKSTSGKKPRRISTELVAAITRSGANHGDGFVPTVNFYIKVDGMTCDACSQHVKTSLTKVPGVASSSVNFKGGYAVVVPSKKEAVDPNVLVHAVERAGYKAIVRTGP